ncbi:hypothetical protein F4Y59_10590 [Candidatus Poribacteria bacterium]|nr:hypothetical protein [Candidatus Poribacteria bacterium]
MRLVSALPAKETDGTGVTIEVLKPTDSIAHSKALVIHHIKPKHMVQLVDGETTGIKIKELWWTGENPTVLPKDSNEVAIVKLHHSVLIELFNTTKSRINLQDWQIRFTYGAMPDDTTVSRIIDRMSNVDDSIWGHRNPQGPKRVLSGNVSISRHVDLERLNDPTKTQDEQLAAISDGTLQTGWDINEVPHVQNWIEIYNAMDKDGKTGTNENGWKYLIELQGEEQRPHVPEIVVPSPPTDDR